MKKGLLLLIALVGFAEAWAFSTGDNVYTKKGRYKVVGESNLLVNGDFADGLNGWTSDGTTAISDAVFDVLTDENGMRHLMVNITRNAADGGGLFQSVKVETSKTYVVYYKVKSGAESSVTSVLANGNNFQSLFTNSDGASATVATQLNAIRNYTSEWTEIAYEFVAQEDFVNIYFYRLPVGECFADIGVYEVEEISDDRKVKEAIGKVNSYKDNPLFANGKDMLGDVVAALNEIVALEDKAVVETMLNEVDLAIEAFLDENTANATEYLICPNFDDAKVIKDQQTLFGGGWTATGTRWLAKAAAEPFSTTYIERSIGGKYKLPEGEIYQTINLPAGKYMFTMRMLAKRYANGNDHVEEDYSIRGIKLFINNDSVECNPIYAHKATEFTVYADVAEGTPLTIGAYIPADECNLVLIDDTELRLIGGSAEQLEQYVANYDMTSAKEELLAQIDSAKVLIASSYYLYAKDVLSDSVAAAQKMYDVATTKDQLTEQVRWLAKTIASFHIVNREYNTLAVNIDTANALVADEKYTGGKTELQSAVATADAYIKTLTSAVRDSVGLVEHNNALLAAINQFYTVNSSYAMPGNIGLVNPDFLNGTDGWKYNIDPANKAIWQSKDNAAFANGHALVYSRGRSAADPMYVWQDVSVSGKGLYEFTAEIVAWNTEWSYPDETGVKLFVGADSVTLRTDGSPKRFKVRTVIDSPGQLRVGLDAQQNVRCCEIMISGCSLLYYGDYEKYKEDSLAAELEPTREALQAIIDEAKALKNGSRNPNGVDTTPMDNAIAAAENAKNDSDIDAMNKAALALDEAQKQYMLSGVWPAEGKYFDITFAVKQHNFGGDGTKYSSWTIIGAQPAAPEGAQPYLTYYYGKDMPLTSRIEQTLEGMPQGDFKLLTDATYRLKLTESFNFADYDAMMPVWLFANNDSVGVKGLLTDADENYVTTTLKYSLDDYRHGRNIDRLFDAGYYTNELSFALAGESTITLGLSVVDIPITSGLWADRFELRFYGKDDTNGIEAVKTVDGKWGNGNVYTISGVKVADDLSQLHSLPKGIYIVKGKKVLKN